MIAVPATPLDVAYVAQRMRAADRREVFALRLNDDVDELVHEMIDRTPFVFSRYAFAHPSAPYAPIALMELLGVGPGLAIVNMIATDRWPEIARAATAWVRGDGTRIMAATARRVECRAWTGHAVSRRWLRHLGFVEEGVHRALGRRGEDFVTCAWINPNPPSYLVERDAAPCA